MELSLKINVEEVDGNYYCGYDCPFLWDKSYGYADCLLFKENITRCGVNYRGVTVPCEACSKLIRKQVRENGSKSE